PSSLRGDRALRWPAPDHCRHADVGEGGMSARIIDPMPFMGIDSGLRILRVSKVEQTTLLRAAVIVENAHAVLTDHEGDGHYNLEASLCITPDDLRALAEGIAL